MIIQLILKVNKNRLTVLLTIIFTVAIIKENEIKVLKMEIIEQYSSTYEEPYKEKRVSCRGVTVEDGKILLSHERNTGFYMSPGGSLEEGETLEECCIREFMEETGYEIRIVKPFLTVNEYCYDKLYVSNYFLCEVTGTGERALTETEKFKDMAPAWVDIEDALRIFGTYKEQTPDKESLYLREYTVINRFLDKK